MKPIYIPSCVLLICLTSFSLLARESEGARTNSILLNGVWEFVVGNGNENAQTSDGQQRLLWKNVNLPGPFMPYNREAANNTKIVWTRRIFQVSKQQSQCLAVLRWNRIANGAEAFINGQKVGENEPTGPYQVIVPPGILKPGDNQIVLKIRGAAAVRRSKSGNALIPAGFGVGMPEVTDDVWIDFADVAYMKWVLAIPDISASQVKIRVSPISLKPVDNLIITAQVNDLSNRKVIGRGKANAKAVPASDLLAGEHYVIEVPMPGFKQWTPEQRILYLARVQLTRQGKVLDEVSFRFGMREFGVKNRDFYLNGKRIWLRGSNLVFEWNWGDTITGHEKDYLVTEAREMSMNCFRTHTQPPPRLWADICDEYGTMILAEFPVLYNYADYKFTADEYEIWHRNVLTDTAGWMARLWNHPAVIIWVLSNESQLDNEWEEGPFQDFVNKMDPTRPTMRTGTTGTREIYDVHACGNITETEEGRLQLSISGWFNTAGERATTVSEYMNDFGHPRTQWTGIDDNLANDLAIAQIGAEHTEAMRRAQIDAILPYMYAGWTRTRRAARVRETGKGSAVWKANFASPLSAAWHSALSPVLASLDLFNPDYRTGQSVTNDLYLINELWRDAKVHIDLLLTLENPEFIPEAQCLDNPIKKWSFDFSLKSDSLVKVPIIWKLADDEGCYWLTARLTGVNGRPVLSQRFVRSIKPPIIPAQTRQKTFVLLAGNDTARNFFKSHNLNFTNNIVPLLPHTNIVVIWNAAHLTRQEKSNTKALCEFAANGGRIIVLATTLWDWQELCEVKIGKNQRFSRVFSHQSINNPLLSDIDPKWLIRWNDYPGTVGVAPLQFSETAGVEKLLWAKEPKTTIAAFLPTIEGDGRILFVQLDLQRRVNPSQQFYDPVAERMLINLLNIR